MKRLRIDFPRRIFRLHLRRPGLRGGRHGARSHPLQKGRRRPGHRPAGHRHEATTRSPPSCEAYGKTDTVGKSFAVLKFTRDGKNLRHRHAAPRPQKGRRRPTATRIFDVAVRAAGHAWRRTWAGATSPATPSPCACSDGAVIDPHQGVQAIAEKRIAMTSPASFSDDPLRVLRAARFASVHGFAVDKAIYAKARKVPLGELSAERVADELLPAAARVAAACAGAAGILSPDRSGKALSRTGRPGPDHPGRPFPSRTGRAGPPFGLGPHPDHRRYRRKELAAQLAPGRAARRWRCCWRPCCTTAARPPPPPGNSSAGA